ncbi:MULTISPECIES: acyl carrier protein [Desulfobacula]|uniref:Acyl carrier protein n=2 Tax=Desulfobacula TaxID=28222 RepID=K0NKA9_DESTT|nr:MULTISPECIES: acyl carrier protein [Desulfobacula]CCK81991.1 AcpP2: acyl carrier protein [Desulfobacula toluolica Tol2]SDU43445.1 acyl carrier protein [Desulfobacula phenolica]
MSSDIETMNIETMINEVFEESFEIEKKELRPEANIFEDLGLDSLDVVDLVVALQKKFSVEIRTDEKIKDIRTLEDLFKFIKELQLEA